MLVLSRHTNEEIVIGDDVTIRVMRIQGQVVRIGIDAPKNTRILRAELLEETGTDGTEGSRG